MIFTVRSVAGRWKTRADGTGAGTAVPEVVADMARRVADKPARRPRTGNHLILTIPPFVPGCLVQLKAHDPSRTAGMS